ncbi:gamma-interferon-inducible lysosomal thiol reductase-like isoform X3 [Daktulosphaira vitifoliae]|uniref:gamma-interferon-inducible lysosomal thiol reductase-like isoform X2 n=1 Tax=Daktulosphaira vitifoliae TaxID=58002 RepID=UPI0021AAAA9F|nr:gamma-interferon-inducible lysosomal thiol reductase-like isoform X2 [Daktulosphaira vitifoliae]XP_050536625.1 gamma-interferon-inducible lysosomal thiol reductase-like isoform X3 [Daktulosphaira vitifoliae]
MIRAELSSLTGFKTIPKPLYDWPNIENQNQNSVPRVTVSIYYESLCPDCINFFTNQLKPNLEKFYKYLNLDFVPYGNCNQTQSEGKWNFTCQHGPLECSDNKWQACAINVLPSKPKCLAQYLTCYMTSVKKTHSAYLCAKKLGLLQSYKKIKDCVQNDDFSSELLAHYGNRTRSLIPRLSWVPLITFNGVFNKIDQYNAEHNFPKAICNYLIPKPAKIC